MPALVPLLLYAAVVAAVSLYVPQLVLIGFWSQLGLIVATILLLALWTHRQMQGPQRQQLRALSLLVSAWRDGDFTGAIVLPKDPALCELTQALNALGGALRDERRDIVQRELLLDTLVQQSPAAFVLCDQRGRVVFHNLAARELIGIDASAQGQEFVALLAGAPAALREALQRSGDILLTLKIGDEDEVFQLSNRDFTLQARPHRLHLMRRLTREFSRQEVSTWKNVIRVISHELNNSLGPILSLSDSGQQLLNKGRIEKLPALLATIGERAQHLHRFIEAYASFARLPAPRCQATYWRDLLEPLQLTYGVTIVSLPQVAVRLDRVQIEQVLINLVKNALEAGSPAQEICLEVVVVAQEHMFTMLDRGSGMDGNVLGQALLRFYSTKRDGTGLGLALAREVVEAHGGRISLRNRDGGGLRVRIVLPEA